MADPSCYVITASDWNSLMLVIAIYCGFGPVLWLITRDWYRIAHSVRVLLRLRRRRLRSTREARRD
ncbi:MULTISPECIES: hypothetical protein [Stenotrophomonas]|uniref:hypothetical protein n=1 Tax=Stenotrophomonas TaxID=40323 RepID=UPI000A97A2B6|nr:MULTISPECIES: hypothetical protein [Stenotrophomonas]